MSGTLNVTSVLPTKFKKLIELDMSEHRQFHSAVLKGHTN